MRCIIFILDAYLTRNSRFCKWEQITKNNTFGNNLSTLESKYASNVKMIQHIVFVSSIPSTIQYVLHITAEIHFYGCSVWVVAIADTINWETYVSIFFVGEDKMSQADVDHIDTATDSDWLFSDIFTMTWP